VIRLLLILSGSTPSGCNVIIVPAALNMDLFRQCPSRQAGCTAVWFHPASWCKRRPNSRQTSCIAYPMKFNFPIRTPAGCDALAWDGWSALPTASITHTHKRELAISSNIKVGTMKLHSQAAIMMVVLLLRQSVKTTQAHQPLVE
jgi:hypothetical protein